MELEDADVDGDGDEDSDAWESSSSLGDNALMHYPGIQFRGTRFVPAGPIHDILKVTGLQLYLYDPIHLWYNYDTLDLWT